MIAREKIAALAFIAALGVSLGAALIGCDFSREEPVERTTEEVLSNLYAAQTESDAVAAIAALEEKTGLTRDGTLSLYRAHALSDEQRSRLGAGLAAFNSAGRTGTESFADVFQRAVDEGIKITADLRNTLGVFEEVVADALVDPEDPNAAFVLAAGVGGPKLPKWSPVDPDALDAIGRRAVSPIQAHFFKIWLRLHGPLMSVHCGQRGRGHDRDASECPPAPPGTCPGMAVKAQVCHKPGTPAQKTLCVPLPAVRAHMRHGDTCGPCHDQGGGG